ncbi:MAG: T9SS type A sorting domain-containing protein [Aureispira sp.]
MKQYFIALLLPLLFFPTSSWSQCANDVTTPIAICRDYTAVLTNAGLVTVQPFDIDSGSSDNCAISTYLINGTAQQIFTCADLGVNTVVLTVIDSAGNIASCNANVTVIDITPPLASCKVAGTYYLNAAGTVVLTPANIDNGSLDQCGIASTWINGQAQDTFYSSDVGTQIATLIVVDPSGNSSSCVATVQIVDTIANNPVAIQTLNPQTIGLKVFPNPVREQLTLQVKKAVLKQVQMRTIMGQLIKVYRLDGQTSFVLPVQELPQGWYTITIITDQGELHQKVRVE